MIVAGDVGGTKISVGLFGRDPGGGVVVRHAETFASADYPGLAPVVRAFLASVGVPPDAVEAACFGVAGPVFDNATRTPNLAWEIDGAAVAAACGLAGVLLINDLLATAEGIPALAEGELATLQEGRPDPRGNAALLAAGTGLGMALLPRVGGVLVPVATEGGHQDFAPRNGREFALLESLADRYGHVSVERVVSGPGLVAIYRHLRRRGVATEDPELADRIERTDPADAVSRAAMGGDALAVAAVDLFLAVYGAVAGNLALLGLATAGLYLGGGIAPKVLDRLRQGPFLDAFRDKGRFRELMERIPVRVITNPAAAMLGAARVAARSVEGTSGPA